MGTTNCRIDDARIVPSGRSSKLFGRVLNSDSEI